MHQPSWRDGSGEQPSFHLFIVVIDEACFLFGLVALVVADRCLKLEFLRKPLPPCQGCAVSIPSHIAKYYDCCKTDLPSTHIELAGTNSSAHARLGCANRPLGFSRMSTLLAHSVTPASSRFRNYDYFHSQRGHLQESRSHTLTPFACPNRYGSISTS